MKNITYMLLSTLILVALPAGCASKKKNAKEVTINNNVDTVSIQFVGEDEATAAAAQEDDAAVVANSKF